MYTQCPECNSIFEITATDLAVAGGFVRCGECKVSFDALSSLSDSTSSLQAVPAGPDTAADTGAVTGADRSETAVDKIVSGPDGQRLTDSNDQADPDLTATAENENAADDNTMPPENESRRATASLYTAIDDDEILLDEAYEPPFIDDDDEYYDNELLASDDDSDAFAVAEPAGNLADTESPMPPADNADLAEADESALFALPLPELTTLEHPETGVLPEKLEGGEAARDPSAQAHLQPDDPPQTRIAGNAQSNAEPPATRANDAFDAQDARDLRDYLSAPRNRLASAGWITGSVLMALLLLGQLVHRHRGELVIHPRLGPFVSSLYKAVGADLLPNWRVNDYKVVGQARLLLMPAENTGEDETAAIRFVAIISNSSNLPQPAPMVRLTLRDRWGDPTGMRDFTPPEYVADPAMVGRLLEPGERLRVVLNLHDLGAEAVGFDFDMCLPDDAGTLRCAHEDAG